MNELFTRLKDYLIDYGFTVEKHEKKPGKVVVVCSKGKNHKVNNIHSETDLPRKNTVSDIFSKILFEEEVIEEDEVDLTCISEINPVSYDLSEVIKNIDESFVQRMFRYIDDKELDEIEVYKQAGIDRKLFSKMRSDYHYQPSKITAICIALGMKLSLEETDDLLEKAGYKLNDSLMFDVIVRFFIENKVYDIYTIDKALLEYDQKTLLRY